MRTAPCFTLQSRRPGANPCQLAAWFLAVIFKPAWHAKAIAHVVLMAARARALSRWESTDMKSRVKQASCEKVPHLLGEGLSVE